MEAHFAGVNFRDWRNGTMYRLQDKRWKCRLCQKIVVDKNGHKKSQKHKFIYDQFENKRYEYLTSK